MKNIYYLFLLSFLLISCEEEVPPITYTLTTQVTPAGSGTVDPALGTYDEGSSVTISATPSENYSFKQWTGTGSGTANPLTFKIISNTNITAEFELIDSDKDGVEDTIDKCPDSPTGATVNAEGCALSQLDSDSDGVTDDKDQCLSTPEGESVDENGCSTSQTDLDGDGVADDKDLCSDTPSGENVDENGCSISQIDTDGDGISDDVDNCLSIENPDQNDKDSDGLGNKCDEDDDNDGVLDEPDNCRLEVNPDQIDTDGDGIGDACDDDDDGDGISDDIDLCPNTPLGESVDKNGCIPEPEPEPIYFAENGVTIIAEYGTPAGTYGSLDGDTYLVVDRDMLISMVLNGDDVSKVVTSLITNMNDIFSQKYIFNQDISSWDVSNVTKMKGMFYRATAFDDTYDISNWDVSNVIDMRSMFEHATSFNQNIGNWDISSVTDMSSMFKKATTFDLDISNWGVSNVTDMSNMFYEATSFNQPIGTWDVSNVTDMSNMFQRASSFNQDLSKWCVSSSTLNNESFKDESGLTEANSPIWGTCNDFTVWNGDPILFEKLDGADPNDSENQDRITSDVWITRGNDGGQIYNIAKETIADSNNSPIGTEWAIGNIDDIESLTFSKFRSTVVEPKNVVGLDLVLHLIEEDVYLSIKFSSWSKKKNGGFAYTRSTSN